MIFVTGGAFSGKAEYVRETLGIEEITPHDAGYDALKTARAVRDIHLFIKDALTAERDAFSEIKRLIEENPNVVLISDEIGCGIVPADKFEREWREAVGRLHCYLAEKSERTVRVVCGIGRIIK